MTETGGSTLEAIRILVALLAAAALAGVAILWLRIPYSVALVAIGLLAGLVLAAGAIQVTPELVLLVLLPGLVLFGIVLFTLVVQGASAGSVVARAGVRGASEPEAPG